MDENVKLPESPQTAIEQVAEPTTTMTPRIQEVDRLALELAKANRKVALANAEKALAQNETAELAYKHTVLQIYVKYGLTFNDVLQEDGTITVGGLAPKNTPNV